jgi:hypothetical protein
MNEEVRFSWLTRLGMACRGLLYIVIAVVVLVYGRALDASRALAYLAQGRTGWLLLAMAVGFAAYGLWRLADGVLDLEWRSPHVHPLAERFGAVGSGIAHLFLAWQAGRFYALGHGAAAVAAEGARKAAETTLGLPGGAWLLLGAGLTTAVVGLVQFKKASTAEFCDLLHHQVARQPAVRWAGRIGYGARGLVFLLAGLFVTRAGWHARASEVGGVDAALAWLTSPWDLAVSGGLFLFGLFCLVEARYRVIREVDAETLKHKVGDALPAA